MKAYMLPRENGYFAVSADDGSFEIANLPAGEELEIQVWHESAGNGLVLMSPEAKELFFSILAHPQAAPTLRALHRHGLLAAYIPEFAPLTCLVQFDLYHRYTVEEHTFHCIEALESLPETEDPALKWLANLYQLQSAPQVF